MRNSACGGRGGKESDWTSCLTTKPLSVAKLKVQDITCTALQEREHLSGKNIPFRLHLGENG